MTSLDDALLLLDNYLHIPGVDAYDLKAFADEDHEGGRGAGAYDAWSIDADEGKVLYALVRALKPARSIEIGVRHGASTAHLLAAIGANESGLLDSYDLEANGSTEHTAWTFHQGDALDAEFPPAEFVFEDGAHTLDFTLKIFEKLKQFAHVVVTHDTNMTVAHGDFFVKPAFETVFPDGILLVLDGCERGLGVWVNPEWTADDSKAVTAHIEQESNEVVKAALPKAPPKPRTPVKKPTPAKAKAKR